MLKPARLLGLAGVAVVLFSACGSAQPRAGAPAAAATPPSSWAAPVASGAASPTDALIARRLDKGVGEQNRGDKAAAVADFLAVIKLDPKNQVAWYDLGVIAQQQNQTEQAIKDYLSSLDGNPNYAPSLYNLAILEAKVNRAYAEGLYQRLLRLQPDNAAAHLNLGFILLTEKRLSEARSQFVEAIHINRALASRIPKAMGGTAS